MPTRSTRFHVRRKIKIPLRVSYTEDAVTTWSEETTTEDVTICGMGFSLSYPVEPNHLIRLTLPMPRQFRLFDFGKEQYDVWGIVRYIRLISPDNAEQIRLMVGVALISGSAPESFLNDPTMAYDLKPTLRSQQFWSFRETPRRTGPYVRSLEERRNIEMPVKVSLIGEKGKIMEFVEATTLNISESGMALVTKLNCETPKYVLIEARDAEDRTISLVAAVRAQFSVEPDHIRLHMEFLSGKWLFD